MRKSTIVAVLVAALAAPDIHAANVTEANLEKAMKDVQDGANAIRGANGDMAVAATSAKGVEAALASVEAFWTARKDDGAVKMSGAARDAARAVAKAAEGKDAAALGEATRAMFGTCRTCHDIHRERQPDGTYRLKGN